MAVNTTSFLRLSFVSTLRLPPVSLTSASCLSLFSHSHPLSPLKPTSLRRFQHTHNYCLSHVCYWGHSLAFLSSSYTVVPPPPLAPITVTPALPATLNPALLGSSCRHFTMTMVQALVTCHTCGHVLRDLWSHFLRTGNRHHRAVKRLWCDWEVN